MGRWKYKASDKCKCKGCINSVRVKGYCLKCYRNSKNEKQL
jgi:hypothetical protein